MNHQKRFTVIVLFFFFLNFILLIPLGNAKPTQTIYPIKDTFITNQYPSINFGTNSSFTIYDDTNKSDALLYFELPINYDDYHNVMFYFYASMSGTASYKVSFYNIKESWNESTVTWDTRPSRSELLLTTTILTGEQGINFKEIIPSYNFSICITSNSSQPGWVQMKSKEFTGIYTSSVILLSDLPDPTIHGYEILIILGLSSIITMIIIKKKRSFNRMDFL